MLSLLSKNSVGSIGKVYCDYFYILALIMIFSIAMSVFGFIFLLYKSMTDKRTKIDGNVFAAFAYALFINIILYIQNSLFYTMCIRSIT